MSTSEAPIVIVGTGLAGYTLAREIRKYDKSTSILMITADDGNSYSKPILSTGFQKEKTPDELVQFQADVMAERLDVELLTRSCVTGIDSESKQVLLDDERVSYNRLILACGASAIRLNLSGDGLKHVYSINNLMDYRAFRHALVGVDRVAIMGAGLIGCEFANDLRSGGYNVNVIAPSESVMPGLLPPIVGDRVIQSLRDEGVCFHLGVVVERIDETSDGLSLYLNNGEILEVDRVISAVGLRPNTAIAAEAGLDVAHGICVNRRLETSLPDIYALGDCAEVDGHVLPYVQPLMSCARALAKTLTGEPTDISYGAMPVMVKTPCCPTAAYPPPADVHGSWHVERASEDIKALFRGDDDKLLGFAITGEFMNEKQALTKELPPIHN
ncbi:FAD-dependent oxidoreductase [Salinivibrio kushneri]|uniref:FAD-dependent oxidoreductase n=1 Tax=Salinivibrio kushneri TaxID=1908198 RepID=UPI0009873388|nr:FAD-dependent oxidoreductase [Salinivibrio kushneri]OOE58799.1 FAD-dependent oxidoreductase [Salinivibrio kushneri]